MSHSSQRLKPRPNHGPTQLARPKPFNIYTVPTCPNLCMKLPVWVHIDAHLHPIESVCLFFGEVGTGLQTRRMA
jgi:hypothetical protein